jgi:hypothetical protein
MRIGVQLATTLAATEQLESGNLKKAAGDAIEIERRFHDAEARAISAKARAAK